jgi:DNA-binding beta-propeller fold protein YncE
VDGTLEHARLNRPHGVTYDADLDTIYVADCMNNRVRVIKGNRVSTLV